MLVAPAGGRAGAARLLRRGAGRGAEPARARRARADRACRFGDAVQVFNVGPASVGAYGDPGRALRGGAALRLACRSPSWSRRGAAAAREGVPLNAEQAYVVEILEPICDDRPRCRALYAPEGRRLRRGRAVPGSRAGRRARAAGREGERPFYEGDVAAAIVERLGREGGDADARGPRRLRGGRARAGPRRATAAATC